MPKQVEYPFLIGVYVFDLASGKKKEALVFCEEREFANELAELIHKSNEKQKDKYNPSAVVISEEKDRKKQKTFHVGIIPELWIFDDALF